MLAGAHSEVDIHMVGTAVLEIVRIAKKICIRNSVGAFKIDKRLSKAPDYYNIYSYIVVG